jgi:hypothetical protein
MNDAPQRETTRDTQRDPIDPALADLLVLFEGPLSSVSFPDVDSATLATLAEEVRAADAEVNEVRAMLEAAQASLEEKRQALVARGHRALAYARIFAADDSELLAKVERIVLPSRALRLESTPMVTGPEPRKRGRPRKTRDGAPLFVAGGVATEEAAAAE